MMSGYTSFVQPAITAMPAYKAVNGVNELPGFSFNFHLHPLKELFVTVLLITDVKIGFIDVVTDVDTEFDSGSITVPLGLHSGRPSSHGSLSEPCTYLSPASTKKLQGHTFL